MNKLLVVTAFELRKAAMRSEFVRLFNQKVIRLERNFKFL